MNDHYSGRARRTGLLATAIATTALVATGANAQDTTAIKPGTVSLGTAPTAIGGAVNIDPTVPPVLDPKMITDGNKAIEYMSRVSVILKFPVQLEDLAYEVDDWKASWAKELSVSPDAINLAAWSRCQITPISVNPKRVYRVTFLEQRVPVTGATVEKLEVVYMLEDRNGVPADNMTWADFANSPDRFIDISCGIALSLRAGSGTQEARNYDFSWLLNQKKFGGRGSGAASFAGRYRNGELTALWRYWNSATAPEGVTYATWPNAPTTFHKMEELVNKDPDKELGSLYSVWTR